MIYDQLAEAGITRDRLKTALDSRENWGGMTHAFEFLTVLGVVLTEWPAPENVEEPTVTDRQGSDGS